MRVGQGGSKLAEDQRVRLKHWRSKVGCQRLDAEGGVAKRLVDLVR